MIYLTKHLVKFKAKLAITLLSKRWLRDYVHPYTKTTFKQRFFLRLNKQKAFRTLNPLKKKRKNWLTHTNKRFRRQPNTTNWKLTLKKKKPFECRAEKTR